MNWKHGMVWRLVIVGWLGWSSASLAWAQMEKRQWELYDSAAFAKAKPAVGTAAPNLELTTLDGKRTKLADYRGKILVVIKGGYT